MTLGLRFALWQQWLPHEQLHLDVQARYGQEATQSVTPLR